MVLVILEEHFISKRKNFFIFLVLFFSFFLFTWYYQTFCDLTWVILGSWGRGGTERGGGGGKQNLYNINKILQY